jgi:hypothetical protein
MARRYLDWITWQSAIFAGACGSPERCCVSMDGISNLCRVTLYRVTLYMVTLYRVTLYRVTLYRVNLFVRLT